MLCNACGVKVLYPIKTQKPKPENDLWLEANHHSHHNGATNFAQHLSVLSEKRPHSQSAELDSSQQTSLSNKRQRTHTFKEGDVKLSPAQQQYLDVERRFDVRGVHVVEWTITDCTIDDTRDFQQLKHAQAFIDECWAFISTDMR